MPKRLETADLEVRDAGSERIFPSCPTAVKSQLERNRQPFCSLPPSIVSHP